MDFYAAILLASSKVQQLTEHIKYFMKLTVRVNLLFTDLNVSNEDYNTLENPNGNSTIRWKNYRSLFNKFCGSVASPLFCCESFVFIVLFV